jgi:hypothetical protein
MKGPPIELNRACVGAARIALAAMLLSCAPTCARREPAEGGARAVIVVKNRFVDPTSGDVLGTIDGIAKGPFPDAFAAPDPNEPGRYTFGSNLVVFAKDRRVVRREGARFEGDAIVYDDAKGTRRWTTPLEGRTPSQRAPDVAEAGDAVAVLLAQELRVLDAATGKTRWRSPGSRSRFLVFGALVVTAELEGDLETGKRILVARRLADGSEAFRVVLGGRNLDPARIVERGGRIVVSNRWPRSYCKIIDQEGRVELDLTEEVADVHAVGTDWLVAAEHRLARLAPGGEPVWEIAPPMKTTWLGAGFLALSSDDILVFEYGLAHDSGVGLVRVSTAGVERWRRALAPLGVPHSEYYHAGYVLLDREQLIVVSQGSSGSFVELVEPAKGAQLRRWTYKESALK